MIIDAHVNITHNGKWFNTDCHASLERLLDEMGGAGVYKCLLIYMPLATTNNMEQDIINKTTTYFAKKSPPGTR